MWASAYYISGDADSGRLPVSQIDFSALTEIIHFALFPNADGTLRQTITEHQSRELITAAHAAGCKVVVCMGEDNDDAMRSAASPVNRATLIKNLMQIVATRGYDGIDLDDEAVGDKDIVDYTALVTDLRAALDAYKPGLLLSAAVASEPKTFAALQGKFDQINLMAYDLSGKYENFRSWYNCSLYGDPTHVMEHGKPYPSASSMVRDYVAAGIQPSKIVLGLAFYGYVWTGIDSPRESIATVKQGDIDDGSDYAVVMDKYYSPSAYHWDSVAASPYLSFPSSDPKQRKFITYDDRRLTEMKIAYARQQGLGGVMIWELGAGYRKGQPDGQRDLLLQSVKQARLDPTLSNPAQVPSTTP